jgi:hypothetical protein
MKCKGQETARLGLAGSLCLRRIVTIQAGLVPLLILKAALSVIAIPSDERLRKAHVQLSWLIH